MGKVFDGCYSVYAWIWNHVWGTLLLGFGLYLIFGQGNIGMGLLGVAAGIYFYWNSGWTKKAVAAMRGSNTGDTAEDLDLGSALGGKVPAGSVTHRKTLIRSALQGFAILSLLGGSLAINTDEGLFSAGVIPWAVLALASFVVSVRIRFDRPAEDMLPALPWQEMVVAVIKDAVTGSTTSADTSAVAGQPGVPLVAPQPAPEGPVPPGSLTSRKLQVRGVFYVVVALSIVWGLRELMWSLTAGDMASVFSTLLMYGIPGAAAFWVSSRIRFDRPVEDGVAAGPWVESVVATIKGALAPSPARPLGAPTATSAPVVPGAAAPAPTPVAPAPAPAVAPAAAVLPVVVPEPAPEPEAAPLAPDSFDAWSEAAAPAPAAPIEATPLAAVAAPATDAAPAPEPAATDAAAAPARRLSPRLLIVFGVVISILAVLAGYMALELRAAGQTDSEIARLIGSAPSDGRDVTMNTIVVTSVFGSPAEVQLAAIGNEDAERYTVVLTDRIFYSIDQSNATASEFLAMVSANPGYYVDVIYNKDGIRSMNVYPNNAEEGEGDLPIKEAAVPGELPQSAPTEEPGGPPSLSTLISQARSDGTSRIMMIVFSPEQSADSGLVWFTEDGGDGEWWQASPDLLGDCYVDKQPVGAEDFLDAVASGAVHGMINFSKDGVIEIRASTDPDGPTDGY